MPSAASPRWRLFLLLLLLVGALLLLLVLLLVGLLRLRVLRVSERVPIGDRPPRRIHHVHPMLGSLSRLIQAHRTLADRVRRADQIIVVDRHDHVHFLRKKTKKRPVYSDNINSPFYIKNLIIYYNYITSTLI